MTKFSQLVKVEPKFTPRKSDPRAFTLSQAAFSGKVLGMASPAGSQSFFMGFISLVLRLEMVLFIDNLYWYSKNSSE